MPNKALQEERMRGYFIQATKELLRGEGLKSVSVRNIADKAGYSYATLYNYFKDVKELVFICVQDFQEECREFIKDNMKEAQPGMMKIKWRSYAYIQYFIQYPGIFELFFLEKLGFGRSKSNARKLICSFLDTLNEKDWAQVVEEGVLNEKDALRKKQLLNSAITGLLLMYLNRQCPSDYGQFLNLMNNQLSGVLS